jgi:Zn-dependent protease with chaperone function
MKNDGYSESTIETIGKRLRALATSDQALVQKLLRRKVTTAGWIMEIFSIHPNITKRLRALQDLP